MNISDPRNWLGFVPATLQASPLYSALWEWLKDDAELLALMALVDTNQPIPITFFTAVNYLLFDEAHHPLALYYPYLHRVTPPPLSEAYSFFRDFVLAHREELQMLLPVARLQTNEVTRCSNLLPAFGLVYRRGGYGPLHMIEIGSSAGFNLLWHLYSYQYGSIHAAKDVRIGNRTSPVCIRCEVGGTSLPPLPEVLPRVARCQGIELVPRDVHDEKDMRWVQAAIWPEELHRYLLLDTVIGFAQQTHAMVHKGDACQHLPALLAGIPEQHTTVIWHSYALHQGPLAVKEHIEQQIAEASRTQTIYRISLEFVPEKPAGPLLEVYEYRGGEMVRHDVLAHCAVHGERMTWLSDAF